MSQYELCWIFSLLAVLMLARQSITASCTSKLKLASSVIVEHANFSRSNTPKSRVNAQVSFVPGVQLCCYNSTPHSASAS